MRHSDYGRNLIRAGTPDDAEAVARVHVESWGAAYDLVGPSYAILWVLETNPRARRFYEASGWILDGKRRPITVGGVEVPEVRYAKTLGGVERA